MQPLVARKPFRTAQSSQQTATGMELLPSAPGAVALATVTVAPMAAAMEHAALQATRNTAAWDHALLYTLQILVSPWSSRLVIPSKASPCGSLITQVKGGKFFSIMSTNTQASCRQTSTSYGQSSHGKGPQR